MSTTTDHNADIADYIGDLIRPARTTEKVKRPVQQPNGKWEAHLVPHAVDHPPLLVQLKTAAITNTAGETLMSDNVTSKPPARVDAIALLERIRIQSHQIVDQIGSRRGSGLADRLSGIAGASADLDHETARDVRKTIRSWVLSARIVTGLDSPPYSPDVPCPNIECERRSSIRIRLADRIATCIECGTLWDTSEVEQLGTYVRWASEHLKGPTHWLVDDDGYPVECTECVSTRREMAARKVARLQKTEPETA